MKKIVLIISGLALAATLFSCGAYDVEIADKARPINVSQKLTAQPLSKITKGALVNASVDDPKTGTTKVETNTDWFYINVANYAKLTDAQLLNPATKDESGNVTYATPLEDLFVTKISADNLTGEVKTDITTLTKLATLVVELGEGNLATVNTTTLPTEGWAASCEIKPGFSYALKCEESGICYGVYIYKVQYTPAYLAAEDNTNTTGFDESKIMATLDTTVELGYWKLQ